MILVIALFLFSINKINFFVKECKRYEIKIKFLLC